MPMLRAVTFDAFGTIVDTGRDVLIRVASAACADLSPRLRPETLLESWDRYFFSAPPEPFRNLRETTGESLERAFHDHGIDGDAAPYIDLLTRLWQEAKAYPDTRPTLTRVDGLPRAVISNADDAFLREILERNALRFDHVVTSESTRTYKPRPKIFEVALEALHVSPEEALHVGDSLTADIGGAARIGMRTIWVNRTGVEAAPGDPRPDFEVPSLRGIPEIVAHLREKE